MYIFFFNLIKSVPMLVKLALTPPRFIEVPVPTKESEHSCICVLRFASFYDFFCWVLEMFRQCRGKQFHSFFCCYCKLFTGSSYYSVPGSRMSKDS